MKSAIPDDCYLASHYVDREGDLENWHYYHDDGRLELVDDEGTFLVCTFTREQVDEAKDAIRTSGLLSAANLSAEGIHDSAAFTYLWNLDGRRGSVTNAATPAREHEVFTALESRLNAIEDAAGCMKQADE